MTPDLIDRLTSFIADDLEPHLNTGHRAYVVDRNSLRAAYRKARSRLLSDHDPGDEDRSER